jgi:tRNA nucleotidyltransferase (CCA-adding enzyme)
MDIENLDDLDIPLPSEYYGLPVFLVGGRVRDTIRGVGSSDTDLMVCEVTPEEMRERGFTEIDNDNDTFGVFIDSLGREVAIAREEQSTGDGHREFDVTPVPEDIRARGAILRDAERRDFTINSLIYDIRHEILHDPHGGFEDLQDGVIRAVSYDSFKQDPLRILRGARFAARFDFEIDETTKGAMWESVEKLPSLPQERLTQELEKALMEAEEPSRFFEVLDEIAALDYTFPEIHALKSVPAGPGEYHSEGSAFDHTMMVLDEMKKLRPNDKIALLMALAHDLGKGRTSEEDLPSHPNHESRGADVAREMAERLSMSNEKKRAMVESARLHMRFNQIEDLRISTVIETYDEVENFHRMFDVMVADNRGREGEQKAPKGAALRRFGMAKDAISEWTGERLIEEGYSPEEMGGKDFGALLRQKRVEHMRELE